jgi:hypothetical protein
VVSYLVADLDGADLRTLLRNWLLLFVPVRQWWGLRYLPRYFHQWRLFGLRGTEKTRLADSFPCLTDWLPSTPFDPHYFYQGAWIARKLAKHSPQYHVDIGSSVLTISVVSGFVKTIFLDYRPLRATLSSLTSIAGSILQLPFRSEAINSLSCMHVLEHIGLGRYGDPIDPDGSRKAAAELARTVAKGGVLYLSVPIGRPRVCFNAHRVFSPDEIPAMFSSLTLVEFSWIDDAGGLHQSDDLGSAVGQEYACGLYQFEK